MSAPQLTLFHAPNTRSSAVLWLLEELQVPYALRVLDMKQNEHQEPAYLAINPLGKVPAIQHGDAIVTESVAVMLYLADAFPAANMAPGIGDPLRGPYLRWMTLYAAAWEPAIIDRHLKREPGARSLSPYGTWDTLFKAIADRIEAAPYISGQRFTAADVLWGSALRWMTMFGLVPSTPGLQAYVERTTNRPANQRAQARDKDLTAGPG